MSPDDSPEPRDRSGRTPHPESGLFERIREWHDVFPWLSLARTTRLAGSPPLLLLSFLFLGVWWQGQVLILGDSAFRLPGEFSFGEFSFDLAQAPIARPLASVARLTYLTSPSLAYTIASRELAWRWLLAMGWTLLLGTPLALLLARQGALLTAGRPMMGLRGSVELGLSRMLRAWLTALVPTACLVMILLFIFLLGVIGRWTAGIVVIEIIVALMAALAAMVGGLFAFGAHFAIPFGWAAIANEQNPDPLDSLSRGYEYVFRRPLHLAAYILLSLLILLVVGGLVWGVTWSASEVAAVVLSRHEDSQSLLERTNDVISYFPVAAMLTLGWGLVGGVYLLLRRDAGGQDVEDIWIPQVRPQSPLPAVPRS